jgi:peptide/nickel transport system substrate-binding protein
VRHVAVAALLLAAMPTHVSLALAWIETPSLEAAVAAGALPPVQERVPQDPVVARFGDGRSPGMHGGALNLLMASELDTRQMVVYGYARLVGYTPDYRFEPDILDSYEVLEGRSFTFHLRPGHRWSDGQPFTAEDFRYYFEDVATIEGTNDPLPIDMVVEGEAPHFEVLDALTVRYTWSKPNPNFLGALAAPRPLYPYRPAHYLKQFHAKYADPKRLDELVRAASARNWQALHYNQGQQYRNQNPELPSLDPWVLVTEPPAKRFVFRRNPYYHRIDEAGRQLPYIDEVRMNITSSKLIPIKASSGETDLQARGLNFNNFTVLKQAETRYGYVTRLWTTAQGARWALYPNLNVADPEWRTLLRDVRFRRALSLAVDRHEINQVIYYGLARETGNFVLPESPLYDKAFAGRWTRFDPDAANRLLDELGLTRRNAQGTRLMRDGTPLEITVISTTEESEPADVLELIRDSWARIGVRLYSKPLTRELFRNGVFAGSVRMSMWSGLENGIPTPASGLQEIAPTTQQQLQWPKWGQYVETRGRAGEEPDLAAAQELFALHQAWTNAQSDVERTQLWHSALDIWSDQVFSIGLVSGVPQVVIANKRLRNVPAEGIYNWDPGAHFGIFRPDTFWLAPDEK